MASWSEIESAAPEFAAQVRSLFDARKHKTVATLRADGSPRISGIEAEFRDGELLIGMMPASVKLGDVRRDPRVALHSPSVDPPEGQPGAWPGEAKIAGRAVAVDRPDFAGPEGSHFRIDVSEVVLTSIGEPADHLVIQSWHEGHGLERRKRK